MMGLEMSPTAIKAIIDSPTALGDRFSAAASSRLSALGISESMAGTILDGYTGGFRIVFILNACFSALATVTSFFMIRHKELTRGDEEQLKAATHAHHPGQTKGDISDQVLPAATVHNLEKACSVLEKYGQHASPMGDGDGIEVTSG